MKPFVWIAAFGLLSTTGHMVNFDKDNIGSAPPGWTFAVANSSAQARWEVRKDRTAATQPYVLAQLSSDPEANRFPLAVLDGVAMRDGDVSVRLKAVGGERSRAGGVVFRYRDENNYYLARASAQQQNVALFRVRDGQQVQIGQAVARDLTSNSWQILKVAVRGANIQVYLDHRRAVQAYDDTYRGPGKVGLWTVGDSVVYFDDFRVFPR